MEQKEIIADFREKNSMIIANLVEKKNHVKIQQLDIGDYLIGDIAIERKTWPDFINSMIDKRIFCQLNNLKKFPKSFLIIEGNEEQVKNKDLIKPAKGLILSIVTEYKTPIIFTKSEEETSEILSILAKKQESSFSLRPSRSVSSIQDKKQFILEGFPGIGPKTAQMLLEKLNTLKRIFSANEKELKEILGKKYKNFREILDS